MIRVVIIDDEPLARELIKTFLKEFEGMEVVAECQDGYEGFKTIQEYQPDLVFLDIQMPRINGFEMLELLETPPPVIFTTAFDDYALKAFDIHAIDYLLKPITQDRFHHAIKKWQQQHIAQKTAQPSLDALLNNVVYDGYQHRVVVRDQGKIRIIPAQDIYYIEANDDYIKIFVQEGFFLKKSTLGHMEQSFDPHQFIRVHRSYLVPIHQILRIEPYEKDGWLAVLHCDAKIPVSKTGLRKLKLRLGW